VNLSADRLSYLITSIDTPTRRPRRNRPQNMVGIHRGRSIRLGFEAMRTILDHIDGADADIHRG
jgi:hypothetical protein